MGSDDLDRIIDGPWKGCGGNAAFPHGNERTTISYDALDREQHRVLANGGTISHTWDSAGREILIENRNAAGAGQFIATNTYSAVNNRLTVVELDGTHCTFGYDTSSQVISEARSGTYAHNTSYVFDPNGNRFQQYDSGALTQFTLNAANELLVIVPSTGAPTTQSFDAAGNMIGANTGGALTTQTWSGENRMLSLQKSDGTNESYLYSQDGLRKEKTNTSGTTFFTWDEQNVLLESNSSGVLQARNTDYPGYWGGQASQNRGGVSSFYGHDSQGSARILTSDLGAITDYYAYMASGVELAAGATTVNPNRYLGLFGYYRDFINWMYVRARLLDALRGRWANKDEIGFVGGQYNLFEYVQNRPTRRTDPSGLLPIADSCGRSGKCGQKRFDYLKAAAANICDNALPSVSDPAWMAILMCALAKYAHVENGAELPPTRGDINDMKKLRACMNQYCKAQSGDSYVPPVQCQASTRGTADYPNPCATKGNMSWADPKGVIPNSRYRTSIFICVDHLLPCSGPDGTSISPNNCFSGIYGVPSWPFGPVNGMGGILIHEMVHGCGITYLNPSVDAPVDIRRRTERLTQSFATCIMEELAIEGSI